MNELDYLLQRTDDLNTRYYFKVHEADQFYMSATTWQKRVLPISSGLLHWMKNKTPEEQEQILLETSHRGSFIHEISKEYADHDRSFSLSHIDEYVDAYMQREVLAPKDVKGWSHRAGNWLYSLNAFFVERDVVPLTYYSEPLESEQLMTEVPLVYDIQWNKNSAALTDLDGILHNYATMPTFPFAGTPDLVCVLDFNGSRQTAIVDYKSGNIWPNHPYQLEAYKLLVESNFDVEIDLLLNFTDKNWRKTKQPTYTLKNQTGKVAPQEMAALYILAEQWCSPKPGHHVEFGDLLHGEGNWESTPAEEYYKEEA